MKACRQCLHNTPALHPVRYLVVLLLLWQIGSYPLMSQSEFGENVQYFPQFAIGGGSTTFFSVHDPSTEAITVKIELFLPNGSLLLSQARGA